MVSADHFRQELLAQMGRASSLGQTNIVIASGDLCRALGAYPNSTQGVQSCCDVMQEEIKAGDVLLAERNDSAGITIRYLLPRSSQE
jgi:hypothetical protein